MSFLIAGDWHGQVSQARLVTELASELGIKHIYHVGDFGWMYNKSPESFRSLPSILQDYDVTISFIDGNHENHEYLQSLIPSTERDEKGHIVVPNTYGTIRYIQRGSRWEDQGVTFAGLGGAASLRVHLLSEGYDYYPSLERPTRNDLHRLGNAHADVILMHDVPALVNTGNHKDYAPDEMERTRENRELLMDAVDALTPNVVFSGHWHTFKMTNAMTMSRHDYIHVILDQQNGANVAITSSDFLKKSYAERMSQPAAMAIPLDGGGVHTLI